ncbi:MAG: hypothetical protein ACETWE_14535 [Candidatus Bathyarchaeia archaeon]
MLLISPEFLVLRKKDTTFTLQENPKYELERIAKGGRIVSTVGVFFSYRVERFETSQPLSG